MELLAGLAEGAAYAALSWISAAAGCAFSDWRARRRGEPLDRGMHWAYPGDPDY